MKKIAAAALLSAVVATPAFAADNGVYVGFNLGSGKPGITPAAPALSKTSSTMYGGLLGYQYNKNMAAEIQYTGIGQVTDTAGQTAKGHAYSVAAVGMMPMNDSFALFGKLGVAITKTVVSAGFANTGATRTALTYGLGAQYNVNQNLGVRAGWDRYDAATTTAANVRGVAHADVLTVGVVYKF